MGRPTGSVGKTSRWAFLVSEENCDAVADALQANYFQAAISPLHNLDTWDRPGIIRYMNSWRQRRTGVSFLYDDDFESNGLSYDDCLIPVETPKYVVWPFSMSKPMDMAKYPTYEAARGTVCYAELPSPGDKKKAHHHFQVNLDYAMTKKTLLGKLGVSEDLLYYWEPVNSWQGLLRYYAHMDNPEKAQYRPSDIRSILGFDLSPIYRKSEAMKDSELEYVFAVVSSYPGCDLYSLSARLIRDGRSDLARAVKGSSGYWKEVCAQLKKAHSASSLATPEKPDYSRSDFERVSVSDSQGKVDQDFLLARLAALENKDS